MSNKNYSKEIYNKLFQIANNPSLKFRYCRVRYEVGDEIAVKIKGVFPVVEGIAKLTVEKFIGGGFAGQVYLCRLKSLNFFGEEKIEGLEEGKKYTVKINIPPNFFSLWFRNLIYWLAFQGPFSAQVSESACHSGLLFQKLMRRAGKIKFGSEKAIKDVFAFFYDAELKSYGEISEWIEGRMWRLESDSKLQGRKNWKTISLTETESSEYIAKRRFMAEMVDLAHEMGAFELARQYEWWTMKSQTNSLYRSDFFYAKNPKQNLCAIDFRSGLALLPFLPMSPADAKLIFQGLGRGNLVQFDRYDLKKTNLFFEKNVDVFSDMQGITQEFFKQNRAYRRSLPDITHQGFRLILNSELRKDIRIGLAHGYFASGLIDELFLEKLKNHKPQITFCTFYFLGIFPIIGKRIRKFWGNKSYREHILEALNNFNYLKIFLRSHLAGSLINWYRAGRVDEQHIDFLLKFPIFFVFERALLGFFPAKLHSVILRPVKIWYRFSDWFLFLKNFMRSTEFREKWILNEIEFGEKDGLISEDEAKQLKNIIQDSFVVKYLKYLGVHFFSVLVTRFFSLSIGLIWAIWLLVNGYSLADAFTVFGLVFIFFQVIPISPGSIFRGLFVVYLMIKERNLRGYVIAALVSFLKYIGYFAFPLQMTTTYPQLARFMASRWAIKSTHFIPVFGERGALLEHLVFDAFFNYPQKFFLWARPRLNWIFNLWMIGGIVLASLIFYLRPLETKEPRIMINIILATLVIFVFPRIILFLLNNKKQ